MALKNCPECNKEVSDDAMSCPNCGKQLKEKPMTGCGMVITIVIVIIIAIVVMPRLANCMGLS